MRSGALFQGDRHMDTMLDALDLEALIASIVLAAFDGSIAVLAWLSGPLTTEYYRASSTDFRASFSPGS